MTDSMVDGILAAWEGLPIRDSFAPGGELDVLRKREAARAAIDAMRHYTYDMEQAGMAAMERSEPFELVWNRVINVALASIAPKLQEPSSTTGGLQTQVLSQPRTRR